MSFIPKQALDLIKEFEGCYLRAYPDPLTGDKPITIGWGCTKKLDGSNWTLGEHISQEKADSLLINQLERDYWEPLTRIPTWDKLNDNQKSAILSFAYNLGSGFFGRDGFNSITRLLNSPMLWKNNSEVTRIFTLYCNPGTNVEDGLRRRRNSEAILFLTPVGN
jgi:lysozyme